MEQLLHYVWKHKMFPLRELKTTDGKTVEVIDPGLHNRNAGPDFFNAKVKIGGTLWVGNVEIHDRASQWKAHHHGDDAAYDNVVLHVVGRSDCEVSDSRGRPLPQMELETPPQVEANYNELIKTDTYPPCYKIIPTLPKLLTHAWLDALRTERLERKRLDIERRAKAASGSWEDAYFATLARNFGFGVNSDAFEEWARHIPLDKTAHHRDDIFQIEAIFMGQAGLLDNEAINRRHRDEAAADGHLARLKSEYTYLAHKFSLQPMDWRMWRFLRLRPQNFPHIRISQMANLYHLHKTSLAALADCETTDALRSLLSVQATEYWETHYTFGAESERRKKRMAGASINLLLINTAIPMLFAYGKHTANSPLCERAIDFLDSLKAENNHIIRTWKEVGLSVATAGDSQALLQLKNEYCDRKDCLRCRIGYEFLKKSAAEQSTH